MENVRQDQLIESRDVWKRGLIMLLFTFAFGVGQMVLHAMAVVQFLWLLAMRERNEYLARFGASLSNWFAEVAVSRAAPATTNPSPGVPGPDSSGSCQGASGLSQSVQGRA
jgi:uncharacterized membrane protein